MSDGIQEIIEYVLMAVVVMICAAFRKKKIAEIIKPHENAAGNPAVPTPAQKKKQVPDKMMVRHKEELHTHDQLSEYKIRNETPDEHYKHQIEAFKQAGLIDNAEAKKLWENYKRSGF